MPRDARAGVVKGRLLGISLLVAVGPGLAACEGGSQQVRVAAGPAMASRLHVVGNRLVDANGDTVQFHGVNRSGTEYACVQGWGIFDGPSGASSVRAIARWHVNAVRIPLNEDCWLGINGVRPRYAGIKYRRAIVRYVHLLHRYGIYAELSLMWAAPGGHLAGYQANAPDEDHSPAAWASMANTFKRDPKVILAPWGETTTGWICFMHGCSDQAAYGPNKETYRTAGMQQAVAVMRRAGYHGPIAIPCIAYANLCGEMADGADYNGSTWLKSRPTDPDHQLVAEAHVYGKSTCDTPACFNRQYAPLAKRVPLIFGETGETYDASQCGSRHVSTVMNWADAHGVGYAAWAWNTSRNCSALVRDYAGTPRAAYGVWVKSHYARQRCALAQRARLSCRREGRR